MACREATLLMEKREERKLDIYEKLALRFHLVICDGCRRYNKQSEFLNQLLKKSSLSSIVDSTPCKMVIEII
jgi:hypothetical protein